MDTREEILDAIEILIDKKMKDTTQIQNGTVTSVGDTNCSMVLNGILYDNIAFYGDTPIVNAQYRVFIPAGNMSQSFIIVP